MSRRHRGAAAAIACAIAASVLCTPITSARAAGTGMPVNDPRSVQFAVHGDIAQFCALGRIDDVDFGDISRSHLAIATHVQLDCNVPFQIRIEATNGGLTNTAYPQGQGPYAGSLDYTLGISIALRRPAAAMLEHSFSSHELLTGRTLSSGDGIALDGMGMTVALGNPAGKAGLLGGDYAETIVITVAPT